MPIISRDQFYATPLFQRSIKDKEFGFSVRLMNNLVSGNIGTIGDLVQRAEQDLSVLPGMGRLSLKEIHKFLATYGLELETKVEGGSPACSLLLVLNTEAPHSPSSKVLGDELTDLFKSYRGTLTNGIVPPEIVQEIADALKERREKKQRRNMPGLDRQ